MENRRKTHDSNQAKEQNPKPKTLKIKGTLICTIMGICGFIWLLILDWKIGLAVFLMMWGNNVREQNSGQR